MKVVGIQLLTLMSITTNKRDKAFGLSKCLSPIYLPSDKRYQCPLVK